MPHLGILARGMCVFGVKTRRCQDAKMPRYISVGTPAPPAARPPLFLAQKLRPPNTQVWRSKRAIQPKTAFSGAPAQNPLSHRRPKSGFWIFEQKTPLAGTKTAFSGPPAQNPHSTFQIQVKSGFWIFHAETPSTVTYWDCRCGLSVSIANFSLRSARSCIVIHIPNTGYSPSKCGILCPRNQEKRRFRE
jgi:hypothetical protein